MEKVKNFIRFINDFSNETYFTFEIHVFDTYNSGPSVKSCFISDITEIREDLIFVTFYNDYHNDYYIYKEDLLTLFDTLNPNAKIVFRYEIERDKEPTVVFTNYIKDGDNINLIFKE